MVLQVMAIIIVVPLGFYFNINTIEWIFVIILFGLLIVIELINTSIEAIVDLVTSEYHELAKVAKDTASAAEFTLTVIAVISGIIIFLPKVIAKFF